MNFLSLIESKRDGAVLPAPRIREAVTEFTAGRLPDYQMAAFLMAVFFRGLNPQETRDLTLAMRDSGEVLELPQDPRPVVDKHSTGGIGDKVSLPLAPLLACLGFRVPMISGRGLGITGGTLDKLESIPGYSTIRTADQILEQVQQIGCTICGQTECMVPADRKLYALRDVTGTVPSIPLIVASILSKKLAEGLQALVLDVKCGTAAFMPTRAEATELARAMVALANECGVKTRALITDMNTPLGRAAGNWLEVKESVDCLEGRGPEDLRELVLECAAELLVQGDLEDDLTAARTTAEACLDSGEPRQRWDEMIAAQGAELDAFHRKLTDAPPDMHVLALPADRDGHVARCDARAIGEVIRDLGGGRLTKDSAIHHEVGVDHLIKPGEPVEAGYPLCRVHASSDSDAQAALTRLQQAFEISDSPPDQSLLVVDRI